MGGEKKMNRLLYGDPDPKALAHDMVMKEKREYCPECNGYGRIIYYADTGEQITEEEFRLGNDDREMMIDQCERCEGTGFINFYIEEDNPFF